MDQIRECFPRWGQRRESAKMLENARGGGADLRETPF
jgi:hypothetical protein